MLTRRILPCLNVIDGRVKKRLLGSERLLDVGDPVELAFKYQENGADGLVFITDPKQDSSGQELLDMIEAISQQVFMPLTVVCNVRTVAEVKTLLLAGADKVSLNSSAVADPDLISAGARLFGNQCLVTAIDVKTDPTTEQKMVYTHGGPSPPASRRLLGPSRSFPWARGSSWSLRWTRTAPRMGTTPPFTRS